MSASNGGQVTASSLIVVSNRLPFVLQKDQDGELHRKSSAGGLVTAVAPVVVQSGGMRMEKKHILEWVILRLGCSLRKSLISSKNIEISRKNT